MQVLINMADEDYKWLKRFCGEESEHFNKFKLSEISIAERLILNGTPFPDNATNGDMIKAMFPHYDIEIDEHKGYVKIFYEDFYTTYPLKWWNSPYKRGE